MRLRLALTLDIRRDREPEPEQRETQLDSLVERSDPPTRIGLTAPGMEPAPLEDKR